MKELTERLKKEVEQWCEYAYTRTLFYNRIKNGTFTQDHLTLHLYNVEIIIQNSLRCLQMAEMSSRRLGYKQLAEYFEKKYEEERDHDQWARDDYMKILKGPEDTAHFKLLPGTLKIIERLHRVSRFYPMSMLSYIFLGEYHIVLVGPRVSQMLHQTSGDQSTLLDRHIELDVGHVDEDLEVIDQLMMEGDEGERAMRDMKAFMSFQIEMLGNIFQAVPDEKAKVIIDDFHKSPPEVSPSP